MAESVIEVTAMRQSLVRELGDDEVAACGLPSLAALLFELGRTARKELAPEDSVWVVDFQLVGPAQPRADLPVTPETIDHVRKKLAGLDARANSPWTGTVLRLIGRSPGTVSTSLAAQAGLERLAFKADVRKLKALGLTRSLLVGYELTPLGEAMASETEIG